MPMLLKFPRRTQARRPNVWATNGGIYLGSKFQPANRDRPLEGKQYEATVSADAAIKTAWPTDGDEASYSADRHILCVGPNGSGKTRKILFPNLYRLRDWTVVAVDPKGEGAAHCLVARAATPGHRAFILDPFQVMKKNYPRLYAKHPDLFKSRGLNPVASLDPESDSFIDDAKALASALIKTEDARDPYWPMAAQALVKGLILAVRLKYKDKATLGMARDSLGKGPRGLAKLLGGDAETGAPGWIKELEAECPAIANTLNQFASYSPDDKELKSILHTAIVQTDWLDSPGMKKDLSGPVFDAATLKKQPTSIFLVLPPGQLAEHGVWLRLMITSLLLPLLRSVESSPVPVLFVLEEAAALGNLPIIENNYALLRGFGVKLLSVWQDCNQIKRLNKDGWESWLSNAGIIQAFAPQDLTTRQYLANLSGDRIMWHEKESTSNGCTISNETSVNRGASITHVNIKEHVCEPHELAALQEDESAVFYRRGQIQLTVLPQIEHLPDVSAAYHAARREIEE